MSRIPKVSSFIRDIEKILMQKNMISLKLRARMTAVCYKLALSSTGPENHDTPIHN